MSRASSILADWFTGLFVANPTRQNVALDTIRVLGGELSGRLVSTISWALHRLDEIEPQMVKPWRIFLESRLHLLTRPGAPLRLSLREAKSNARTLALLRRAVLPRATLSSAPLVNVLGDADEAAPSKPSMTLKWPFPLRDIRALWDHARADLSTNGADVIEIFEQALIDAIYHEASFDETQGPGRIPANPRPLLRSQIRIRCLETRGNWVTALSKIAPWGSWPTVPLIVARRSPVVVGLGDKLS